MYKPINSDRICCNIQSSRNGFSIVIVVVVLLALSTLSVAFLRKSSQQAAWANRYVEDQAALEAAIAGIAVSEDRLLDGRWYSSENPSASHGYFSMTVDQQANSSVFVVCQDYYSEYLIKNGKYESAGISKKITTPGGYFHTLHSVGVFSKGSCGNTSKIVFARFIVAPDPLAYGGSMEGIRNTTDGSKYEFPYADLCSATSEKIPGAGKIFICLPGRYDKAGKDQSASGNWKFRIPVSVGDIIPAGQILYTADKSGNSVTVKAHNRVKVISAPSSSGEGDYDEPIMIVQDLNYFASSGHTIKKMVRRTLIPEDKIGTGNLADNAGCREVIRQYVKGLDKGYLERVENVFEDSPNLESGIPSDEMAEAVVLARNLPLTKQKFVSKMLPQFIPPGLSGLDRFDYDASASIILDREPASEFAPPEDPYAILVHEHFFGRWPADKAKTAVLFSQPLAINKMLKHLAPSSSLPIDEFIKSATVFKGASYRWSCNFSGAYANMQEIEQMGAPNGVRAIQANGQYFLIHPPAPEREFNDNAYDLEYGMIRESDLETKRIRMSDVALFLLKIVSDDGLPVDGSPAVYPLIEDVQTAETVFNP